MRIEDKSELRGLIGSSLSIKNGVLLFSDTKENSPDFTLEAEKDLKKLRK